MKPANFGIVFAMLFLSFLTVSDHGTKALQEVAAQRIMYNNCLDSAIEDAMTETVEVDTGQQINLNKQEAINEFFTALAVNFDAMENPGKKELLKAYVPAIVFIERAKITIYYDFFNGGKHYEVLFQKVEGDYRITFTLTDYVYVENMKNGETLEGDFHDVGQVFLLKLFQKEELFYEEQKQTIREELLENLEKVIAEHNEVVKKLGIQYRFFLPVIENEEWYRGIEEISMMVFFQGYPYGNNTIGYYNRMAIGGAEIKKKGSLQ